MVIGKCSLSLQKLLLLKHYQSLVVQRQTQLKDVTVQNMAVDVFYSCSRLLEEMPVEMYIHQSSDPSIPGFYPVVQNAEGSILMQVFQSTGGPDIPVATVNSDCVVGVVETSFGSVKALYR